ncbi:endonuclease domain-containing protein [Mycolicibacterium lutetiense]
MEPFIGSAAVRSGELTRHKLARHHVALYRDVYVRRDLELTALIRAQAAWLSTGATLAGTSAAAILGTKWLNPAKPAEVIRADRRAPAGLVVHSWTLGPAETCTVAGIELTSPARTAFDLGRSYRPELAVPLVDAVLNATNIKPADVLAMAEAHPGTRGVARLRSVLPLLDGGAESPQESRLRLVLVHGGLPTPETQIEFRDLHIRVDMGWREWKVAVEYDGVQHWTDRRQRSWDIDRIALLEEAGWTVVRVSAEMMSRPHNIVERVRSKLRGAGCPV